MPFRLTKISTRTGDEGYTHFGKERISKDDLLLDVIGTLDELNSSLGLVVSLGIKNNDILACLTRIQHDLFDFGGELHSPEHPAITAEKTLFLEEKLTQWNANLPPLTEFLLPRGNPPAAACHLARTICRRAERYLVRLHRQTSLPNPELLRYLNRLSDLLFIISRLLSREENTTELVWEHPSFS